MEWFLYKDLQNKQQGHNQTLLLKFLWLFYYSLVYTLFNSHKVVSARTCEKTVLKTFFRESFSQSGNLKQLNSKDWTD